MEPDQAVRAVIIGGDALYGNVAGVNPGKAWFGSGRTGGMKKAKGENKEKRREKKK